MLRYVDVIAGEAAPDAAGPDLPRPRPAVPVAGSARPPRRRARCSSAPTSAASGCTSRCSRAATTGRDAARCRDAAATPRASGRSRWRRACRARRRGRCCRSGVERVTAVAARSPALTFAYPDGHAALLRRRPAHRARRAGRAARARTARARPRWCCTSTASSPAAPGSVTVGGLPVATREPARRSAAGSASSSRTPTTSCSCRRSREDVAFGPANFGRDAAPTLRRAGRRRAGRRRHGRAPPTGRRRTSPAASAGGWRWPPCWRASRRSWCSTSRRRTSTRSPAASWPRSCCALDRDHADGHPRPALRAAAVPARVVLDDGAVVADGPTRDLLADAELLARHRLELPFGFSLNP